ncbi:hypothetical protein MTO96_028149 [Rhipicephalus appendiculatus]
MAGLPVPERSRHRNSRRFLGDDLACLAEALLRSTATSAERRPPPDVRPEGGGGCCCCSCGAGSGGVASAQQYVYERPKARRKNFSIAVSNKALRTQQPSDDDDATDQTGNNAPRAAVWAHGRHGRKDRRGRKCGSSLLSTRVARHFHPTSRR